MVRSEHVPPVTASAACVRLFHLHGACTLVSDPPQRKDETSTWLALRLPQPGKRQRVRAKIPPGLVLGQIGPPLQSGSHWKASYALSSSLRGCTSRAKLSEAFQVYSGKPVQSGTAFAARGKIIRINSHRRHQNFLLLPGIFIQEKETSS